MNSAQKKMLWGISALVLVVFLAAGAFMLTKVNVAFAAGFISRRNLDMRLKQVQFLYDLETLGTNYQNEGYAVSQQSGILEQMIAERLLVREARKKGFTVTEEERQNHATEIMTWLLENFFYGSEEFLADTLTTYNMTKEDLESYVVDTLEVHKLREDVVAPVSVSEEDARLYFEAHREEFDIPELIRVSHILVQDLEEAEDIIARVKRGEDFAELAKLHSLDTSSAVVGGDLNWQPRGTFVEAFDNAAWALTTKGQLSEPVKTEFGHHVIRFEEKIPPRAQTFAEVEEDVKDHLKEDLEFRLWSAYVDELRTRSRVFVFLR